MKIYNPLLDSDKNKVSKKEPKPLKNSKCIKNPSIYKRHEVDFLVIDTLLYESNGIEKKVIGRPTVYAMADMESGLIIGTFISTAPPHY